MFRRIEMLKNNVFVRISFSQIAYVKFLGKLKEGINNQQRKK